MKTFKWFKTIKKLQPIKQFERFKRLEPLGREGCVCLPAILGLILLGVSSCGSLALSTAALSESNPPKIQDSNELVQNLTQRIRQFRSLRALATVSYRGTDGRAGFQEAILVHRPDRLRLETLSPLGAILIVTADADNIEGFHPREGLFYRGRSSKENLLRYTHIPLELEELTSLLMGLPPMEARGCWEGGENSLYREIHGGGKERTLFDPSLGAPVRWERLNPDGAIDLSAVFSDYVATAAGLFPLTISLEDHNQQKRLEIRYQEPELNMALPSPLFIQEKPAGARELPLESLGG